MWVSVHSCHHGWKKTFLGKFALNLDFNDSTGGVDRKVAVITVQAV